MESLTAKEIARIRKVNEFKRIAHNSEFHKLIYGPGANLFLLQMMNKKWMVRDETGKWYEPDDRELIEQ